MKKNKLALAAVSGILYALASPGFISPLFHFIALIPFLWALKNESPWFAFSVGFIQGCIAFGFSLYWMPASVSAIYKISYIPASGIFMLIILPCLAVSTAFFGAFSSIIIDKLEKLHASGNYSSLPGTVFAALVMAAAWSFTEYFRGTIFPAMNLNTTAAGFYMFPGYIQPLELTGEHLFSFHIVMINYFLFYCIDGFASVGTKWIRLGKADIIISSVLVFFMTGSHLLYSMYQTRGEQRGFNNVFLSVQANIGTSIKWDRRFTGDILQRYLDLTEQSLKPSTRFVLWPETALNFFPQSDCRFSGMVRDFAARKSITIFSGAAEYEKEKRGYLFYNSVFRISPESAVSVYRKSRLIPFAEYCPLSVLYPLYRRLAGETQYSSSPITKKISEFAGAICFESTFPGLIQERLGDSPLLVVFSDDMWLFETAGPFQHLASCVLRAVENRKPVIHCVNGGISTVISAEGIIIKSIPSGAEGGISF